MDVIYSGLIKNIDVSIYLNPSIKLGEMERIRLKLERKIKWIKNNS